MSGSNAIAQVGPDGKEKARFPDPVTNMTFTPPLDSPIDIAFRGTSLIVANSGFLSNSPSSFALLDVFVGETGHEPLRPKVAAPPLPRLQLSVTPRKVVVGKRVRFTFKVTAESGAAVSGARVRIGKKHMRSDDRGRASMTAVIRHAGTKRASVLLAGYRSARATFQARR
jgi:hypothetical protein